MRSRITARKALFHTSVGTTSRLFKAQSSLFSSFKWVTGHNTFIRIHTSVRTPLFKPRKIQSRTYSTLNVKNEAELLAMEMHQQTQLAIDLCSTFDKARTFADKYKFIILYTTATLLVWNMILDKIRRDDPESYPKRPALMYSEIFLTPSPLSSTKDLLKIGSGPEPNSTNNFDIFYGAFKKSLAEPFWYNFQFPVDLVGINYKGDDITKSRKYIGLRAGAVEVLGTIILPLFFFVMCSSYSFQRNSKSRDFAAQAWDKTGAMASGKSYEVIRSIFNGNKIKYMDFLAGPYTQIALRLHTVKLFHAFNLMITIPAVAKLFFDRTTSFFKAKAELNDEQALQIENSNDRAVAMMYVGATALGLARMPYVFLPAAIAHLFPKVIMSSAPVYHYLITWIAGEDIETVRDKYKAAELVSKINNKQ
eukprot:TRINITY_DN2859_c0_g1_i1.p1 TRINITY_DN2859_c0_g1~~TRINITY_DN2859_c0_g1_i1.p1  ORF type:complete len:421 (+),score=61.91 TRINITY_DN2859_c0_g1_i1:52-1314(+)